MLAERLIADELMDDPTLDPATYQAVVGDLAKVNSITLARRPTLGFLKRALAGRHRYRVLDVGFGDGDMLRAIARWAAREGAEPELVGIDLNPRSTAAAKRTPSALPITYLTGDYRDLAGQEWDCVISSLVAHHMTEPQLLAFLRFMESESRRGWIVNDLHRHNVAYALWPVLARVAGWHRIVRLDGHTSIGRSFRPNDWDILLRHAQIRDAKVVRRFPFRLCVERLR